MSRSPSALAFDVARDTRVASGAAAVLLRDLADEALSPVDKLEAAAGLVGVCRLALRSAEALEAALREQAAPVEAPALEWTRQGHGIEALFLARAGATIGPIGTGWYWLAWVGSDASDLHQGLESPEAARAAALAWLGERGVLGGGAR